MSIMPDLHKIHHTRHFMDNQQQLGVGRISYISGPSRPATKDHQLYRRSNHDVEADGEVCEPDSGGVPSGLLSPLSYYRMSALSRTRWTCYTPSARWREPQKSTKGYTGLQGSLACTDWDIFQGSLDEKVTLITDYINFCIHCTIPVKNVTKYPNPKPWITPHIKHSLKEKQNAFKQKDWATLKVLKRQTENDIIKAKMQYRDRLEQEFSNINTKQAFQKVKILTGQQTRQHNFTNTDLTELCQLPEQFLQQVRHPGLHRLL